jgi:NAD(P)-dependent dehydrogenase (short-subunit alcohol dehydrogenase family)
MLCWVHDVSIAFSLLADELIGSGGKALAVATDVIHCDQVKRLADTAVETFGRIDVMINRVDAAVAARAA